MRWKAKFTKSDYQHGTTRMKRVFSWIPTYIAGDMIWFETYEILQAYVIEEHKLEIEGESIIFGSGRWKDISKRIIKK